MRVYEERQANLKRRMDNLQHQMNQANAPPEEEKKAPRNDGNEADGPPAQPVPQGQPNQHQSQESDEHQNDMEDAIRGVQVVGAELNMGAQER